MDFRESSLPYHFDWSETDRRGPLSAAASASEPWRARHHGAPVGTMVGVASFHGHAAFALPDFGQMRVFNAAKGKSRKPKTRCWSGIDWNLRYRLIADSKRLTDRLRSIARSLRLPLHLHRQHSRRSRAEHLLPRLPVTSHRPQLIRHYIVEANRRWTLRELRHSLCGGLRRSMRRVGWAQAASVHKPEDHPSLNTTILCLTPAVSVTESVVRS